MEYVEYGLEFDRDKIQNIEDTDTVDEIMEKSIRNLLVCIGGDPDRPGLQETPSRVRRMYQEIFEGMKYTNKEIAEKHNKCFDVDTHDLVVIDNIPIFSMCEHHILPMVQMYVSVGYIPNGKVIGLSKVARIAEIVSRRLQLQERLGDEIADVLKRVVNTNNIIVVIEGEHTCMAMRGVKKVGTVTRTATLRGVFDTDHQLRQEFYSLIRNK